MGDFKRCNKICGLHWLKSDVEYFKIKIKITPQDEIISLPKFEDYTRRSETINLENTTEEYIINWQEKLFSTFEVQRYADIHNCITDTELKYHDMVENLEYTPSNIFTYVNDDGYLQMPLDFKKKSTGFQNLSSFFEKLNINEKVTKMLNGDTTSVSNLFRSEENITSEVEEWRAMHVMFDSSEYVEDSQLLFKQEEVLLSVYHNRTHNYLLMAPDVNNLELNPYILETETGGRKEYLYSVEMEFDKRTDSEDLVALLTNLYQKWEKKQKYLLNFIMPPPDKKQYHIVLEILTAKGFDMDNLYIEFNIKVPEEMHCHDKVQGGTHISAAHMAEDSNQWHFGHIVEFTLEMQSGIEPDPLKLFLEVISSDWWGRHRTEGYSYLPLHLEPGCYTKHLSCQRPQELNTLEAESRRFFVGGCHLIKDLNVLAEPQIYDTNFTYTSTGTITLRWHILKQQCIGISRTHDISAGSSTASALLQGAETAISRYKKARSKLAQATRQVVEDRCEVFGDG